MALVVPVILCGGSGTRLWPLSRSAFPKQFLSISGDDSGKSLFQLAIERLNSVQVKNIDLGETLIVTNEDHRFLVLDQLREIPSISATLLLEPEGRNTAPALTLAALHALNVGAEKKTPLNQVDPILVVTPADHTIQNLSAFTMALEDAIEVVQSDASLKTIAILGITPTGPETGYGYIKSSGERGCQNEFVVQRFVEKPDVKTARAYIKSGNYFWNSGIFVMRASTWISALNEFCPDIFRATEKAWNSRGMDDAGMSKFIRPDKAIYKTIPTESIDYAVIEKCTQSQFVIKMLELDAGWNDLGAWDAVWQVGKKDRNGNVISGDVILSDTRNSLVYASSRLLGIVGLENVVIVETADALLVADRSKSQDVKVIVNQLGQQKRDEKNLHRKVSRPWGWYDSVDEGERFKVKRIQVKPGASLSLQMHHHRAEHWIVVKGTAEITNGDKVIILTENQSAYIPQGQIHRLSNPGKDPLEIIEVQSGNYLGEDDIVRFEDSYGRSQ